MLIFFFVKCRVGPHKGIWVTTAPRITLESRALYFHCGAAYSLLTAVSSHDNLPRLIN